MVAFHHRHGLFAAVNAGRGRPPHEDVIQDVEIPVERGAEFLRFFDDRVGMSPVWMCPLRLRGTGPGERPAAATGGTGPGGRPPGTPRREPAWPLYPLRAGQVCLHV